MCGKAGAIKRMDNERDSLCAFHLRIATFDRGVQMQRRSKRLCLQWMVESTPKAGAQCAPYNVVGSTPKAGAIKRMDNERDSLGGFRLRNATFDAGCANAAAGQDINREKGWCALRTLHIS